MGIRNEAEEVKRIWRGLEGGRGPKGPRGGQGAPGSGVRGGRGNAKGACGPRRGARGQLISECGSDLILYRARCDSSLSSSFDTSLCALGKTEQAVADLKFTYRFGPCPQLEQQVCSSLFSIKKIHSRAIDPNIIRYDLAICLIYHKL